MEIVFHQVIVGIEILNKVHESIETRGGFVSNMPGSYGSLCLNNVLIMTYQEA